MLRLLIILLLLPGGIMVYYGQLKKKKFHKKELKRVLDLARKKKVELKEQHQKILKALKDLPEEDILKDEKKEEKKEKKEETQETKREEKQEEKKKETPESKFGQFSAEKDFGKWMPFLRTRTEKAEAEQKKIDEKNDYIIVA